MRARYNEPQATIRVVSRLGGLLADLTCGGSTLRCVVSGWPMLASRRLSSSLFWRMPEPAPPVNVAHIDRHRASALMDRFSMRIAMCRSARDDGLLDRYLCR